MPVSILKPFISTYYEKLGDIFNNCIRSGIFPEMVKKNWSNTSFQKRLSNVRIET